MYLNKKSKNISVFGRTGVGKSALCNLLLDATLITQKEFELQYRIDVPEPKYNMKVGHNNTSTTERPSSGLIFENDNLVDIPGINDNRGTLQNIANALYIKYVFKDSKNLKLIFVIKESDIIDVKSLEFFDDLKRLILFMPDVE